MRSATDLRPIVDAILDDARLMEALRLDGWPQPMGFAYHRETWDPSRLERHVRSELDAMDESRRSALLRRGAERTVVHVWPSLPGAGVTPVLYGYLLGVEHQQIKPSSAGRNFAEVFVDVWRRFDHTVAATDDWRGEHVIASGADETIEHMVDELGVEHVVGYGHRVSGAIVVEGEVDLEEVAALLATDIVLWNQSGCFSARGVVFVGSPEAGRRFGGMLANAVAEREEELQASVSENVAAARMQRRGRAEFETEVWRARTGWVERRDVWAGEWIAARAVSLTTVEEIDRLASVIDVPSRNIQGFAIGAAESAEEITDLLLRLGATRVCAPGRLQAPEPEWLHDGYSNVLALLGPGVGRVGDNAGAQPGPDRVE